MSQKEKAEAYGDDEVVVVPGEDVEDSPLSCEEQEREHRRTQVIEAPFNPVSLLGSWCLYHSDEKTEQGLIVGEIQPGIYLMETFDLVEDTPIEQRVIDLARFGKSLDDEGGFWTFYDNREEVRAALFSIMGRKA